MHQYPLENREHELLLFKRKRTQELFFKARPRFANRDAPAQTVNLFVFILGAGSTRQHGGTKSQWRQLLNHIKLGEEKSAATAPAPAPRPRARNHYRQTFFFSPLYAVSKAPLYR